MSSFAAVPIIAAARASLLSVDWEQTLPGEAVLLPTEMGGTRAGSSVVAIRPFPTRGGNLAGAYLFDYYYRIYVVPAVLTANNPQFGIPIPFAIWNAYPQPTTNTITGITALDADGLVLSAEVGDVFAAVEYRAVTITVTPDAPPAVDANFIFTFTEGAGPFRFIAAIANVLGLAIEEGLPIEYEWLTDVLRAYDGTESRVALRARPRRTFKPRILIQNDAERKQLYDTVYKGVAGLLVLPAVQHQSPLRADTIIGDTAIVCNTKQADLRVGEFCIIRTRAGESFLFKVLAVDPTFATIDSGHAVAIPRRGAVVTSAISCRVRNGAGVRMNAIAGSLAIDLSAFDTRAQLTHPASVAALTLYNDVPVLERRPLDSEAPELFDAGLSIIDNETGKPAQFTAWDQKYFSGERQYQINTLFEQTDIDYWFTFLDYCRGRQRSFYTSTFRNDLVQAPLGVWTGAQLEVVGLDYNALYASSPTYQNIELVTSEGTFYLTVDSAEALGDNTLLTFLDGAPVDPLLTTIERISYLPRVRLLEDTVTITYENTRALVNIGLRAVRQ